MKLRNHFLLKILSKRMKYLGKTLTTGVQLLYTKSDKDTVEEIREDLNK
jgi:hypothetical protein